MTTERDLIQRLAEKLDRLNRLYNVPDQSALVEESLDFLSQPEPEYPSDKELLELMPETMRDEFSCIAKLYSDATGGQVEPGIFRVALNTAALEYAQAVLARSDQTSEFRRFQQTHCYD